jgi:hypothetical protein
MRRFTCAESAKPSCCPKPKAQDGDVPAIKELADRLDGKVAQAIIGGEDDDPAVKTFTTIELIGVRPSDSDT